MPVRLQFFVAHFLGEQIIRSVSFLSLYMEQETLYKFSSFVYVKL
jgi:hypothetical protein